MFHFNVHQLKCLSSWIFRLFSCALPSLLQHDSEYFHILNFQVPLKNQQPLPFCRGTVISYVHVSVPLAAWHLTHYFDSCRHREWVGIKASVTSLHLSNTQDIKVPNRGLTHSRRRWRQQTKSHFSCCSLPLYKCFFFWNDESKMCFWWTVKDLPWCGANWMQVWLR